MFFQDTVDFFLHVCVVSQSLQKIFKDKLLAVLMLLTNRR